MSVYIELVMFNNFFLDLSLLYLTQTVRRRKFNVLRGIFASLMGAICATAYPIVPAGIRIAIKILLAPAMCAVAFSAQGKDVKRKIGDRLGTLIIFVLLTFFAGGVVYGLSYAFRIDIKSYAVLGLISIALITVIGVAKLIARKRSCAGESTCSTSLRIGGSEVRAQALCDSGNLLVDDVSGLPVVILSQEIEDRLGNREVAGFINVNTVSGEDSLALIDLDGVKVGDKEFKALGALSHRHFEKFDVILQNSMF